MPYRFPYNIFYFLSVIFASPVPVLLVITAKIFFSKKFSNKHFGITLVCLLILLIISSYYLLAYNTSSVPELYPLTLSQKINEFIAGLLFENCKIIIKSFFYIIPLLFISSFVYFFKTKDKSVFKKLIFSLLIYIPFIYISYPCHKFLLKDEKTLQAEIERNKYVSDKSVLLPVKAISAYMVSAHTEYELYSVLRKNNSDFQAEELKPLIKDYIKYRTIVADAVGYKLGDLDTLRHFEQLDELEKAIDKIEKASGSPIPYRIELLIAKKQYQKALDIIEQVNYKIEKSDFDFTSFKYLHYAKIYTGLKKYDKAYEYLEKYKNTISEKQMKGVTLYHTMKFYLDYKAGNMQQAEEDFEYIKRAVGTDSMEECIKKFERIDY